MSTELFTDTARNCVIDLAYFSFQKKTLRTAAWIMPTPVSQTNSVTEGKQRTTRSPLPGKGAVSMEVVPEQYDEGDARVQHTVTGGLPPRR